MNDSLNAGARKEKKNLEQDCTEDTWQQILVQVKADEEGRII